MTLLSPGGISQGVGRQRRHPPLGVSPCRPQRCPEFRIIKSSLPRHLEHPMVPTPRAALALIPHRIIGLTPTGIARSPSSAPALGNCNDPERTQTPARLSRQGSPLAPVPACPAISAGQRHQWRPGAAQDGCHEPAGHGVTGAVVTDRAGGPSMECGLIWPTAWARARCTQTENGPLRCGAVEVPAELVGAYHAMWRT
jgi:hypothetical protein